MRTPFYERGFVWFPFISVQHTLFTPTHPEPAHPMQDPRFCSACGAGPFTHMQNHTNKCKESKKREIEFMSTIRGIKRDGPTLEREIWKRRQPLGLTPQVRACNRKRFPVGIF